MEVFGGIGYVFHPCSTSMRQSVSYIWCIYFIVFIFEVKGHILSFYIFFKGVFILINILFIFI